MTRIVYRLKVRQVGQTCIFELSWGQGQQLTADLAYPPQLQRFYQEWQQTYLTYYRQIQPTVPVVETAEQTLRGRAAEAGSGTAPPIDWAARLGEAEARLLVELHRWLRSAELFEIRAELARAHRVQPRVVDVFLTCTPIELERLPWETWDLGQEFAATASVHIARTPANLPAPPVPPQRRGKTRILVILGDDSGLDFKHERWAVQSLSRMAMPLKFLAYKPGEVIADLKQKICTTIADPQGWDMLLFAGHSNETVSTGGELAIAPGASLSVKDIAPALTAAKNNGLQFALFNSCSGLSIATALVELGLNQVVVMREPVHNQVAGKFIVHFLQVMAQGQDVHAALLSTCQFLQLRQLNYPAAYLVPSLFRYPEVPLFQLQPVGLRHMLRQWRPTWREAWVLGALIILSLLPPVQDLLLESRLGLQAVYRDRTNQLSPAQSPPVLLVQIDSESIDRAGIDARKVNPFDRAYLARLLTKVSALNPQVVGLDYVLDRPTSDDSLMVQSVQAAAAKGVDLVFAGLQDGTGHLMRLTPKITATRVQQGYIDFTDGYVELPASANCQTYCPFAYLLAQQRPRLRSQASDKVNPLTSLAPQINQWFQPIIDYSIPPDQVYTQLPAWQLLQGKIDPDLAQHLPEQVVIIAAGGYDAAGINAAGEDNFPVPLALAYWQRRAQDLTGAEIHAYMIHHYLKQHWVVPVPDLWLLGIAAILGKGTLLALKQQKLRQRQQRALALAGINAGYVLLSLQVYIWAGLLFPWLLPSALFWSYLFPTLRKPYVKS